MKYQASYNKHKFELIIKLITHSKRRVFNQQCTFSVDNRTWSWGETWGQIGGQTWVRVWSRT